MPYGDVTLIPGVNIEKTPTLNQAGISSSSLIRFKDSLVQKIGGWQKYYGLPVAGTPRDMHAWQDLNNSSHLGIGTTNMLGIVTGTAGPTLVSITPQTKSTSFTPSFTTALGATTVVVNDPNLSAEVTNYDSIYFQTPVSVGGLILSGLYPIDHAVSATSFVINAQTAALSTATMTGFVPRFTATSGLATIATVFPDHGLATGGTISFPLPTSMGALTISGVYSALSITNTSTFTMGVNLQVATSSTFSMNNGSASLLYYINVGPPAGGGGFGSGGFGSGGFGTGSTPTTLTGTAITATDWTSDNWGQIYLACPENGGVYQYDPLGGFTNAGLVNSAPPFNGGIFVSTSQQQLFCWASTVEEDIGLQQDPMVIRWSDIGDYTQFEATVTNQAGLFRISIGSKIKGGMATPNQNLFWTDLDLWAANYQGPPFVWGFNKIGAGAGLISSHAAQQLRDGVYWMGSNNFYSYVGSGVQVLPCPVWDAVFQNINTTYVQNVRAMPNTPFNEVGWEFPSSGSANGECDTYVKFNITEPNRPWDIGPLARSAWIDLTILGPPIGATPSGVIYQHETATNNDGAPITSTFTTGYYYIGNGEDFAFVDQVLPDFKWGTYTGSQTASIQISFNVLDYPGNTPAVYGPYTVTQATEAINVRFRGRQMSLTVTSSDLNSWWRIGKIRYRWSPAGRR